MIARWIKDPFFVFLVVGIALYTLTNWLENETISYQVDVDSGDIERLSDQWFVQMQRAPNRQELDQLIKQFVKEEIYYREGQRLGLDVNDTIVRRRVVQKLKFLTEDVAAQAPLDNSALITFYDENSSRYRTPERYSFNHRFFSTELREKAMVDAQAAIVNESSSGDPFMLQKSYALRTQREVRDLFGEKFSQKIALLDAKKQWQGPIQSPFGWHAVQVTDRRASTVPPLDLISDKVIEDAKQAARIDANDLYYLNLKSRYSISLPELGL